MATILLNGVVTPLEEIFGDALADKITVRGGAQDVEAQGLGGNDLFEVEANNEDVDITLRGGEGEDVIVITSGDPEELEWVGTASIDGEYIGGVDNDSIEIGDGLAILKGDVKGNAGEDTITVARAEGGFINGGADNDDISLGFASGYGTAAGSRAEALIVDSTIFAGADDDNIVIKGETEINDSIIKGQKGNDTITVIEGATGDGNFFQGSSGDDELNVAKLVGEGNIARGGKGNDTIRGGNGQEVYGDLGGDLFSVEAEGGMFIKDYGGGKFAHINAAYGEDVYPCDDQIQIDGHKIFYTTNEYCIDTDVYSSENSFKGNLKAAGYVDNAFLQATANAYISTDTSDAADVTAVAHAFIGGSDTAKTLPLPEVEYKTPGITIGGFPFTNGLNGQTSNKGSYLTPGDAVIGSGIGQAYAFASGYWTDIKENTAINKLTIKGNVRTIIAQTYASLFGATSKTFNKSGTTAFDMDSDRVERSIRFTDALSGTITNHWASYKENKSTERVNLYNLNFGTALFKEVTTGKVYQKVGDDQNIFTFTKFYDSHAIFATATATIDAHKNPFKIFVENPGEGTTNDENYTQIKLTANNPYYVGINKTTNSSVSSFVTPARILLNSDTFSSSPAKVGFFADATIRGKNSTVWYDNIVSVGSNNLLTSGVWSINKLSQTWIRYSGTVNSIGGRISSGDLLGHSQFLASTARARGLFTITTTAILGNKTGSNNSSAGYNPTIIRGPLNTDRSYSGFNTGKGKLAIKVELSDKSYVKTSTTIASAEDTTTLSNFEFDLYSWTPFPEIGSSGKGSVYDKVHPDQPSETPAVLVEDTENPVKQFLQWNGSNNLQTRLSLSSVPVSNDFIGKASLLYVLNKTSVNLGFFSGTTFTLGASGMEDFGKAGIQKIANDRFGGDISMVNSTTAPFRVLFWDQGAVNGSDFTADGNGLYIYSGAYHIKSGQVADFTTQPFKSSAMGGKHTIVTIEGKSAPASISDINLV